MISEQGSEHFFQRRLQAPKTDRATFAALKAHAERKAPAANDVKYWGGDPQPWRNGTTDAPITDAAAIAAETTRKAEAEGEDAAAGWNAEALRARGVRSDWLLAMTFALDLWDWATWEVLRYVCLFLI